MPFNSRPAEWLCVMMCVLATLVTTSCATTEPKKKRPTPPPPPGSDLSSQPWSRPEKDWEGGKPAFMPGSH